jgi:hypothetical protein
VSIGSVIHPDGTIQACELGEPYKRGQTGMKIGTVVDCRDNKRPGWCARGEFADVEVRHRSRTIAASMLVGAFEKWVRAGKVYS